MKRAYLLAAIFAAVATHRCVDFLVSLGLAPGLDRAYAHVAVGPVAVAAIAMFAALIGFAFADRDRWFVTLVRGIEATSFRRAFAVVLALATLALFGMESLEQVFSLGHLDGGFAWLGTTVPIAFAIFSGVVAAVVLALRAGARALVSAMDAIRAFVEMFIASRPRHRAALAFARLEHFVPVSHALAFARVRGMRAPPHAA